MLTIFIILLLVGWTSMIFCVAEARHNVRHDKISRIWISAIFALIILSTSIAGISSSVKRLQRKAIDKYINGEYEVVEYSVNGKVTEKTIKLK